MAIKITCDWCDAPIPAKTYAKFLFFSHKRNQYAHYVMEDEKSNKTVLCMACFKELEALASKMQKKPVEPQKVPFVKGSSEKTINVYKLNARL